MDELELIRTAHGIDHALGRLVEATTEATLRDRIAGIQSEWREVTYRIAAQVCGIEAAVPVPVKRRGRRPRLVQTTTEADGRASEVSG